MFLIPPTIGLKLLADPPFHPEVEEMMDLLRAPYFLIDHHFSRQIVLFIVFYHYGIRKRLRMP
jgi:hypothetical protein